MVDYFLKNDKFNWLDFFNKETQSNISLLSFQFEPWLSGFTDAEGCFLCYVSKRSDLKRKLPYALRLKYVLSQKDSHDELLFITTLIGGNVQKDKSGVESLVINNIFLDVIVNYFTNHPLKTKKLKSYGN